VVTKRCAPGETAAGQLLRCAPEIPALQLINYLIHQVVGWSRSVALLRDSCPAVYDVTIGYHDFVDGERPSELSILAGIQSHT
jgi:hypothetical protein